MGVRDFIAAKKSRFQTAIKARNERKEVARYKDIVERERRVIKLEAQRQDEQRIAELKSRERELRTPSFLRGFSLNPGSNPPTTTMRKPDSRVAGIKQGATQGIGRPTLFGNPNSSIGEGYRGPDFSNPASNLRREDIGDNNRRKKNGYDPFGYKGIF
jgi:hypothetical protein